MYLYYERNVSGSKISMLENVSTSYRVLLNRKTTYMSLSYKMNMKCLQSIEIVKSIAYWIEVVGHIEVVHRTENMLVTWYKILFYDITVLMILAFLFFFPFLNLVISFWWFSMLQSRGINGYWKISLGFWLQDAGHIIPCQASGYYESKHCLED